MSHETDSNPPVVDREAWIAAHQAFLAEEKEHMRRSDELARRRRELPRRLVDKPYKFLDAAGSPRTLADLFAGRSQLALYHFMFGPDWNEGCPSCSFVVDNLCGIAEHLAAREVSLVLVSRAAQAKLQPFRARLGWKLPWYSSGETDFNHDFRVSFSPGEAKSGAKLYNHDTMPPYEEECPGLSFFLKDASGAILHTYSTYARGLDSIMGCYQILDRVPRSRDEAGLKSSMAWVRYHDKYEPQLHQLG